MFLSWCLFCSFGPESPLVCPFVRCELLQGRNNILYSPLTPMECLVHNRYIMNVCSNVWSVQSIREHELSQCVAVRRHILLHPLSDAAEPSFLPIVGALPFWCFLSFYAGPCQTRLLCVLCSACAFFLAGSLASEEQEHIFLNLGSSFYSGSWQTFAYKRT